MACFPRFTRKSLFCHQTSFRKVLIHVVVRVYGPGFQLSFFGLTAVWHFKKSLNLQFLFILIKGNNAVMGFVLCQLS